MRAPGGPRNSDNDEGAGRSRDSRDHSNTCAKWRIGQIGEYQNNMGMTNRDLSAVYRNIQHTLYGC